MKAKHKTTNQQRRKFLRGSVAAGAGAAITATVPGVAVGEVADDKAADNKAGYQLSQHVLEYYKTCVR